MKYNASNIGILITINITSENRMRTLEVLRYRMQTKAFNLMEKGDVHPFSRLILTVMLNKLNRQMCCEISVSELVKLTGLRRFVVAKHLVEMENGSWISVVSPGVNGRSRATYHINFM